jgi:hypothetical protein
VDIIDGANPTLYPTCIRVNYGDSSGRPRAFYGAMDLPNFNGLSKTYIIAQLANPAVPISPNGNTSALYNNDRLTDTGTMAGVCFPSVWNPYDLNNSGDVPTSLSPSQLRISVATEDLYSGNTYQLHTVAQTQTKVTSSSGTSYVQLDGVLNGQYGGTSDRNSTTSPTNYQAASIGTWGHSPGGGWFGFDGFSPTAGDAWTKDNTALTFDNNRQLFRQPTLLFRKGFPSGGNLDMASGNVIGTKFGSNGIPEANTSAKYIGFLMCVFPQRYSYAYNNVFDSQGNRLIDTYTVNYALTSGDTSRALVVRLEYNGPSGWTVYQEIPFWFDYSGFMLPVLVDNTSNNPSLLQPMGSGQWNNKAKSYTYWNNAGHIQGAPLVDERAGVNVQGQYLVDPRTKRFGVPVMSPPPPFLKPNLPSDATLMSWRPDGRALIYDAINNYTYTGVGYSSEIDGQRWYYTGGFGYRVGGLEQNLQDASARATSYTNQASSTHYGDPDSVVRRAMGGWSSDPGWNRSNNTLINSSTTPLPMATPSDGNSRPIILHRPYRSVAELGTVFRGAPWKNIDFSFPESGDSALLDIFCINESDRQDTLEAGKIDLNTQQVPVLKALISGIYRDELTTLTSGTNPPVNATEAENIAKALVSRTTTRPLVNLGDLVGYYSSTTTLAVDNNYESYDGFTRSLTNLYSGGTSSPNNLVTRYRESAIRALSGAGQVGTWNLMIDVIAQTGRYPQGANNFDAFMVESEKRYWVHLAIDRLTGQVIDKQIEQVNE